MALLSLVMPGVSLLAARKRLWAVPAQGSMTSFVGFKVYPLRVAITMSVSRESVPSTNFMGSLIDTETNSPLAFFGDNLPRTQWFERSMVYKEILAQAYDYTVPKLGMSRWPTLSDDANTLLFNITEGSGGNEVSTVDARVDISAAVEAQPAVRQVAVIEKMSDGQWRVAGYGDTAKGALKSLDLRVTTSGTFYALALDDYGMVFVPGLAVITGQRICPKRYAGWLYQITEPGTLPDIEPQWWAAEGENISRELGTARAIAVRYYRPLAHGPIPVELT